MLDPKYFEPSSRPSGNGRLEKPRILLRWDNRRDSIWTTKRAVEGTFILGSNGSGKTSSSFRTVTSAFMLPHLGNAGGLFLCGKQDAARGDPENGIPGYLDWIRECGREEDLI